MESSGMDYLRLDAAVRDGSADAVDVAHEVGASAASWGVPLHEVLDRVAHAFDGREPTFDMVRGVAVGWAETSRLLRLESSCEDPLTSLSTFPHLRSHLEGLYRDAHRDGASLPDRHSLVVIELPIHQGLALESAVRALDVSTALRTVFTGSEVIAELTSRRFCAVVERTRLDQSTLNLLTVLLRRVFESPPPRVWVEILPPSDDDLSWVLDALTG